MKKIFVTVSGGCAYVMEDTVPPGFLVEVVDFDNIEAGDRFRRRRRSSTAPDTIYMSLHKHRSDESAMQP